MMRDRKVNIILADDDQDDCYFFAEALKEIPITSSLTIIRDGERLINLLSEESISLPDVLFLDLNMPRKSGFECLEDMKQNERLKNIPVIIFSSIYEPTIADKLYKHGARYYICKPVDIKQMIKVIHIALQLILQDPESLPDRQVFFLNELEKSLLV